MGVGVVDVHQNLLGKFTGEPSFPNAPGGERVVDDFVQTRRFLYFNIRRLPSRAGGTQVRLTYPGDSRKEKTGRAMGRFQDQ